MTCSPSPDHRAAPRPPCRSGRHTTPNTRDRRRPRRPSLGRRERSPDTTVSPPAHRRIDLERELKDFSLNCSKWLGVPSRQKRSVRQRWPQCRARTHTPLAWGVVVLAVFPPPPLCLTCRNARARERCKNRVRAAGVMCSHSCEDGRPSRGPLPSMGDLFHGKRASTATDPGSPLSVPDGLVADKGHADGRNEAEGGEGRYHPSRLDQPEQQDRRDRSAPPEASADPQGQHDVRDHVQGDPAAKTERWHDPQRIVHVVEGGLQPAPLGRHAPSAEDRPIRSDWRR
jgi:hypothetical protein